MSSKRRHESQEEMFTAETVGRDEINKKQSRNLNKESETCTCCEHESQHECHHKCCERCDTLQSQIADLEAKNLRLYADIDNLQKQSALEQQQARKNGKKSLAGPVSELINTINLSFIFSKDSASADLASYIQTLESSLQKARIELESAGLEIIIPRIGDQFDPEVMQSLNSSDAHNVAQVVSVGYKIDGQLVTPAVVMIG